MLEALELVHIKFIEILLNSDEIYSFGTLKKLLLKNNSINRIILFQSTVNQAFEYNSYQRIIKIKEGLFGANNCDQISSKYFSFALEHVLESMQFNTRLNKKLSIDENGLIKNCPSCSKDMGFANEATALIKASDSSQYTYYSRLKKGRY